MMRSKKPTPAFKNLNRAAGFISANGLTVSFWILSAAFILGRIIVIPF